jgi:hypothetical protein
MTTQRPSHGARLSMFLLILTIDFCAEHSCNGVVVTIDADQLKVVISNRIREEFENGRDYYQLHGRAIRLPRESNSVPSREYLAFHNSLFR